MKVTVLGDGAMGTACSVLLASKPGMDVCIWSAFAEQARETEAARENRRFLPGVPLPDNVHVSADIRAAVAGAELLVAAIPTVYLRKTLTGIRDVVAKQPAVSPMKGVENRQIGVISVDVRGLPVVSVIKGIENETFERPSQIIREVLGDRGVVALSGPSHAEEISRDLPASVVAACGDVELARHVQSLFTTTRFRVYTNPDIVGVELAAALKNIMGIAAGVCDGLGFGDNAKSALLTRGLAEMTRFGTALGGQRDTFFGLAGMGDLITTCISRHGRNRAVGEALGRGKKLDDILAGMQAVAEGVWTCRAVYNLAAQKGIAMPITQAIYRVLFESQSPLEAVNDLMLRELKSERE